MQRDRRLSRELLQLAQCPHEGFCCYPKVADNFDILVATLIGPNGTPYSTGIFQLDIQVPPQYPFEPPRIIFRTPVYHPNIDDKGRICMDVLNMPPKGNWKPTISIRNLLEAVRCLLGNPNPDDPLMPQIAEEYRLNREEFERKARQLTEKNKHLLS